ncbi:hypothetical protein N9Z53_00145 [Mariniblastus sp.]|nr:hypothetical protein [Mariniblastus sp.]
MATDILARLVENFASNSYRAPTTPRQSPRWCPFLFSLVKMQYDREEGIANGSVDVFIFQRNSGALAKAFGADVFENLFLGAAQNLELSGTLRF